MAVPLRAHEAAQRPALSIVPKTTKADLAELSRLESLALNAMTPAQRARHEELRERLPRLGWNDAEALVRQGKAVRRLVKSPAGFFVECIQPHERAEITPSMVVYDATTILKRRRQIADAQRAGVQVPAPVVAAR